MHVVVSGRHAVVTDRLRSTTEEKIGRLERFLPLDSAEVHFSEERNPRISEKEVCEVTIKGQGHHLRCKVRGVDGFHAIDLAVAKLEKQIKKLKTKLKRYDKHAKRGHGILASAEAFDTELAAGDTLVADDDVLSEDYGYRIVKTKTFELEQMMPAEAALQMDLVDHDFYLFHNAASGKAGVVYRREDGDVGLIDAALPV